MTNRTIKTVAFIHIEDKKILLTRSKGKLGFYMPGGKIDLNETEQQALHREVKEELSVDLLSDSIKHYGVFEAQAYGEPSGVKVNISCYFGEFNGTLELNGEIEELRFFSLESYQEMQEQAPAVNLILKKLQQDKFIY